MGARRAMTRATFAFTAAITAATALTGPPAAAQPGSLDDQIAEADAKLKAAQARLADTLDKFTAAEQQHQQLSAAAAAAQDTVTRTRTEADAASTEEKTARVEFDQIVSSTYLNGGSYSVTAYLGSNGASDLLDRASMLNMLAGKNNKVMDGMRAAVDHKAKADSDAKAALDDAVKNRDAAAEAKATAEGAYQTAVAEQDKAKAETAQLADRRAKLEAQKQAAAPAAASSAPTSAAPSPAAPAAPAAPAPVAAPGAVVKPAQGTLTSTYGARWGTVHYGIDIANSIGTPILAAMSGVVISSGPASGFGLWVRLQHDNGLITVYGHINESLVTLGQRVTAGQQIATLGNRGESTGPHLHFEVHQDGNKIDPLPWLRSHGVAI